MAETSTGHDVVQSVFRLNVTPTTHPTDLTTCALSARPRQLSVWLGESARHADGACISAIVAHADLRLDALDEVLDAHEVAGEGLFRGIRHSGSHPLDPEPLSIPGRAPEGLYADPDFRRGVRRLGERGLTYDTWHYHYQLRDYLELARACPETVMVLDHLGTPLGVGAFSGKRDEIFEAWKKDMAEVAACPNVVAQAGRHGDAGQRVRLARPGRNRRLRTNSLPLRRHGITT